MDFILTFVLKYFCVIIFIRKEIYFNGYYSFGLNMSLVDEIIKGRKTFFIAPDKGLFPENFLEDYLTQGFECYFIESDIFIPVAAKVDIILSIFKDSILFFNIDSALPDLTWEQLIVSARNKYPQAMFGVLYTKRQSDIEKKSLERKYLYEMGLQCGCIQLEYQKTNNYGLISKILQANQAQGRRQNVRAVCGGNCTVKFSSENSPNIIAKLSDISLSHFSLTFKIDEDFSIMDYEKITDCQFYVKGLHFVSDAIMVMKRQTGDSVLYVFAFSNSEGQSGLDDLNRRLLISKIYSIMQENCQNLLDKAFQTVLNNRGKKNGQKMFEEHSAKDSV